MTKVLLPDSIPAEGEQILTDAGLEIIHGTGRSAKQMMQEGAQAAAVLIGTQIFDAPIMDAMPNLKVIARNGVGYDAVDMPAATARGIKVVNTPFALNDSVAETAVTELLAISKNIFWNTKSIYDGQWNYKKAHPGNDVMGKTIGILGFGRIGHAVAQKLAGFNVKIIAHDPFAQAIENVTMVSREELFANADYVLVHLPAMDSTKHSIGMAEFKAMKSTAYLINMARGIIIVETDLVQALQEHEIAGAALDVFEEEPLPLNNPLLTLNNVLLTPHIASNTVETKRQMAIDAANDIVSILNGEDAISVVNK
ncbi:3-phosphoglycerate dehydrogenase [Weissella coleopterorum]|uniref:3-phosphoglycerate dehydrogenase n=1 Tax=Weissella coleopterorum TaxID=2714949 RepID=A0A6G8AZK0_9LACO|nr:NAD(P)-dependent oxidoreductase [Weissella coleopterorum]QIL50303.1 3-phosphoglycerate dehydrogenase [Weissella coleopterorum]